MCNIFKLLYTSIHTKRNVCTPLVNLLVFDKCVIVPIIMNAISY